MFHGCLAICSRYEETTLHDDDVRTGGCASTAQLFFPKSPREQQKNTGSRSNAAAAVPKAKKPHNGTQVVQAGTRLFDANAGVPLKQFFLGQKKNNEEEDEAVGRTCTAGSLFFLNYFFLRQRCLKMRRHDMQGDRVHKTRHYDANGNRPVFLSASVEQLPISGAL